MRLLDAIPPKQEAVRRVRREDPFTGGGVNGSVHRVQPGAPLSDREVQMLARLAAGLTYKQIAVEAGLATSTVRTHLHNIYNKLEVVDRAQAVLKAWTDGLLVDEGSVAKATAPMESLGVAQGVLDEVCDVLREYPEHDAEALRRSLERVKQAKTAAGRANALAALAAHSMRTATRLRQPS